MQHNILLVLAFLVALATIAVLIIILIFTLQPAPTGSVGERATCVGATLENRETLSREEWARSDCAGAGIPWPGNGQVKFVWESEVSVATGEGRARLDAAFLPRAYAAAPPPFRTAVENPMSPLRVGWPCAGELEGHDILGVNLVCLGGAWQDATVALANSETAGRYFVPPTNPNPPPTPCRPGVDGLVVPANGVEWHCRANSYPWRWLNGGPTAEQVYGQGGQGLQYLPQRTDEPPRPGQRCFYRDQGGYLKARDGADWYCAEDIARLCPQAPSGAGWIPVVPSAQFNTQFKCDDIPGLAAIVGGGG